MPYLIRYMNSINKNGPDVFKIDTPIIPESGGIGFMIIFIFLLIIGTIVSPTIIVQQRLLMTTIIITLVTIIGLIDDFKGLSAKMVQTENRQIVLTRKIDAVKAQRALETASITLSLFWRDSNDAPLRPEFDQSPENWPGEGVLPDNTLRFAWNHALRHRPEIAIYGIELQKLGIKTELFQNQILPEFDVSIAANQSVGGSLFKDTGEFELQLGLEFSVPLQRNKTKGAIASNAAKVNMELASENSELAIALREIESDRFRIGATNLLSPQIREQTSLKARQEWIKSQYDSIWLLWTYSLLVL